LFKASNNFKHLSWLTMFARLWLFVQMSSQIFKKIPQLQDGCLSLPDFLKPSKRSLKIEDVGSPPSRGFNRSKVTSYCIMFLCFCPKSSKYSKCHDKHAYLSAFLTLFKKSQKDLRSLKKWDVCVILSKVQNTSSLNSPCRSAFKILPGRSNVSVLLFKVSRFF
jgi:hypothetical protein